jgi:hypothetical protein
MSAQDAATARFLAQRVRLALARAERLADEGNTGEVGAWGFGSAPSRSEHFPVPIDDHLPLQAHQEHCGLCCVRRMC